jgi:hypothetical protein
LILAALVAATSCGPRDRTTPEEEAVRGDELLRTASDTLKNASAFSFNRDITVTYDGKERHGGRRQREGLTTIKAPATLDEMLDLVSDRFDLRMAVADVLYSSPYASFADKESQGGTSCSSNLRPTMSLPPSVT